jgi:uncharacterized GH25 family protein
VVVEVARSVGMAAAAPIALCAAALLIAGELLVGGDLGAHDLWIEPSTFRPAPGATVAVGLRLGQDFAGDPVPRSARLIDRFVVRQGGEDQPIVGLENIDPAGWFRADGQATAVIAYRSHATFVELPAAAFEDYLRQEGLERIIDVRARRGDRAEPGREHFYRYAKALLAGKQGSLAATEPMGLAYEIVPDEDPTVGYAAFRGRVLYQGEPLEGALVVALLRADPSARLAARSDARGAFAFVLPRAGVWLIKSVHLVHASMFSRADWDSLWASLTFELPEPEVPPEAALGLRTARPRG